MNSNKRTSARRRSGFTLIEIMLVVVIIGMLAGLAIVNVPKYMKKGQASKIGGDINSLSMAINAYYMEEGKYPSSLSALVAGDEPYFTGGKVPKDPWGGEYQYSPQKTQGYPFGIQATAPDGTVFANWNQGEKK